MAIQPLGRTPRRVEFQNDDFDLTRPWALYFELIRSNIYDIRDFELTINPSSVGANTTDQQTFTAAEVDTNDLVIAVNKPTHTTGLGITNFSAGDGQINIEFMNPTGSSIDPPEETYLVAILKR